jgi:small subunit ribosomal protein S18
MKLNDDKEKRGGRGDRGDRENRGGDRSGGQQDANGGRRRFPGMDRSKLPPGFLFDFKNPLILRNYITEVGKVMPGRVTRLSAKQQRQLTVSIKRARHLALLPYNDKYKKY